MKPVWHITLFTKFAVAREAQTPLKLRKRRSAELLAYLALHEGRENRREMLAARIWPEEVGEVSRQNLRSSLNLLREHLETPFAPGENLVGKVVCADTVVAALNFDYVTTDVAFYRSWLQQAGYADTSEARIALLRQATALYGEGLLPEWYDDWVFDAQARLRQQQLEALIQLSGLLRDRSENEDAIVCARQALALDEEQESAQECLMRAYLQAGQTGAVLQQYKRMEQRLGECGGDAPSPALQALARQARAQAQEARKANDMTASLRPANLPHATTQFFDRVEELANLRGLLRSERRLITLTAIGGAGKTRLAMETARNLLAEFDGRAFWVELAGLTNAGGIVEAVAETILMQRYAEKPALDQLAQEAGRARVLVVLDNFEHLAETGAAVAQELMRRLPMWKFLVTSRQALGISGEQIYPLPLLPLSADVELFADRAKLVKPAFALDAANTSVVTTLCERLEGIPLSIELAAAWSDMLTPEQILQRLTSRFDLLVSHYKNIPERHRSLYAMIDWSYAQLSPELRALFARLSVFRGGWTAEAAQAMAEGERGKGKGKREKQERGEAGFEADVLLRLRELQARSLIAGTQSGDETRYSMLETLREFALAQISEGECFDVSARHAFYFLKIAETADPHLNGREAKRWLDVLDRERENLYTALDWLHEQRQEESLRLANALTQYWRSRCHVSEGRQHLSRALTLYEEPTLLRVNALRNAGLMANDHDDFTTSMDLFTKCLTLARQLQDCSCIAWALYAFGHNWLTQGDYKQARAYLKESLPLFEQAGELRGIAATLHKIGSVLLAQNLCEEARSYFERSAALYRDLGDQQREATSLLNIGNVLVSQGKTMAAKAQYETCLAIFETLGNALAAAVVQICLGSIAYRDGVYDEARQILEAALDTHRRLGSRINEAWARYFLGNLAWKQGDNQQAHDHYKNSLTLLQEFGDQRRAAQLILAFGWLAQSEHNSERAARLFGAGHAWYARLHTTPLLAERYEYGPVLAATRAALDAATFATCWAEGKAYTSEQAVVYALQEAAQYPELLTL